MTESTKERFPQEVWEKLEVLIVMVLWWKHGLKETLPIFQEPFTQMIETVIVSIGL